MYVDEQELARLTTLSRTTLSSTRPRLRRDVTKGQEPRDHRLQLRVPTSLWLAIKRIAVEYERSPSDWIVQTLSDTVAKHDRKRR